MCVALGEFRIVFFYFSFAKIIMRNAHPGRSEANWKYIQVCSIYLCIQDALRFWVIPSRLRSPEGTPSGEADAPRSDSQTERCADCAPAVNYASKRTYICGENELILVRASMQWGKTFGWKLKWGFGQWIRYENSWTKHKKNREILFLDHNC